MKKLNTFVDNINDIRVALFNEICALNGDITEKELNMEIVENILKERMDEQLADCSVLVEKRLDSEIDTEKKEKNGAYVFRMESILDFDFDMFNTIADAIRVAVNSINAKVICNGREIVYDVIDDKTAYYIDEASDKMKIVNL